MFRVQRLNVNDYVVEMDLMIIIIYMPDGDSCKSIENTEQRC